MRRIGLAAICVLVAVGTLAALDACRATETWPRPVPALASSPQAAAAFEEIREEWADPRHPGRWAKLRDLLERFVIRFPSDGLVSLVRVYLALVLMEQGDLAAADRELAASEHTPLGTTNDLLAVARARRHRLRGDFDAALEQLRPLVGKNVDPATRTVFEEELTLAALGTHREYEAISYMDAWLRATSDEDKSQTLTTVSALVGRIPTQVLVGALQAMRRQRGSLGYGIDIERILAERLTKLATENSDAVLAGLLLDPDAGAIFIAGEAGVELSELATSHRGLDVVNGRTIGLLLPTDSPELRDESADVLRGVMWALGLPRGLRVAPTRPSTTADAAAPATGSRIACAPLEPAPKLGDPRLEDALRLVTRDDVGSAARTEVSLDELAGEGAAVIIAGFDVQTAARAMQWARDRRVPVILLVPPVHGDSAPFAFVLGEPLENEAAALASAVNVPATERFVPIVDSSELAFYADNKGRVGRLAVLPPVSCDIPSVRAGDPRFPIGDWDHGKNHAWLVSGSPDCARDVLGELAIAHARGVVALMLEASTLFPPSPGLRIVSASAGVVPAGTATDSADSELARFSETLGNVTWWTALGRDAATLARVAVRQLPQDRVTDLRAVSDRRVRSNELLLSARTRLWTTESAGWTPARTMMRTVCAIEAPSNK